MEQTTKNKGPYVMWLIHNSQGQIDGRKYYGGLFDDLDAIIDELSPKMHSLSANEWASRDEVLAAFGPEPEDLPEWLDDDLTWPVYECDGNLFASEEEMYDYVADRLEVGSFEPLDACDRDELHDIAKHEYPNYGVAALPAVLLGPGECADEELDSDKDGAPLIRVTTDEEEDERFIVFDDYVVAAIISELYSLYRGLRSSADVYWQMATEQKRRQTSAAWATSVMPAVHRAQQECEAREAEAFKRFYERCRAHGITRERFDAALASDDEDPTHLPAQIRKWLAGLDVAEIRAGLPPTGLASTG
jgi:hypothetical protein